MAGKFYEGPFGWARHVNVPGEMPGARTTVAVWFVHAPGQGIGYDNFMLAVVSLADQPGVAKARLTYPGAEHEVLVVALDPEKNPHPGDVTTWSHMEPINVSVQFHGLDLDQVAELAATLARACVAGRLPVETQMYVTLPGREPKMMYVQQRVDLWKTSVIRLVEHHRTGGLHAAAN